MKLFLFIIGIFMISLSAPVFAFSSPVDFAIPDTIQPPPDSPDTLAGPSEGCIGDTALYTTSIPLGCTPEWYINDTLQGSDSSSMQVIWTDDGHYTISLYFDCDTNTSFVDSIETNVYDTPLNPGSIVGDANVCEFTTHTYSTTVGQNETCEWYVAGELQSSIDTFMVYSFGNEGDYLIEVWAVNNCGISPQSSFLMVEAAGIAPDPPDPIEGPEQSCVGFTEIYTTVVGAYNECQWRVDNILQETTEPELEVTWTTDGQHEIEVRAVTDCGSSNPTTLEVMVYETPLVNLGNDTTIYEGQTLTLDAGNAGSQFLWSTGDTTQTIEVSVSGDYSVVAANFCGEDTDSIFVDVIVSIQSLKKDDKLLVRHQGNLFHIETPGQRIQDMQIVQLSGTVIYRGKAIPQIRLPGNGIYILKVRTDKTIYTRKILVFNN
jgi:hypothetical protein